MANTMNRRSFLIGSTAILAAPSIVRASSLMPVSVLQPLEIVMTRAQWAQPDVVTFVEQMLGIHLDEWQKQALRTGRALITAPAALLPRAQPQTMA